jgi:signal transduction histidine kinase/DNA-binding NarL/FixJ family response regulator
VHIPLRLLIAEDFPPDAELLLAEVRRAGYRPTATVVDSAGKFLRALDDDPEIVICDYTMPTMTAPDALAILREKSPDLPLIVVSGTMDEATCVNSLRLGAADYLLKDRLSRLGPAIAHALARRELDRTARLAEQERRETMIIMNGLVENSVAAISVRNLDGETLVANERYRKLYQDSPGNDAIEPDRVGEREERFDVDAESRTYYAVRYPVRNAENEVFAVGSILVDITVQKQIENDLRRARRELQERAESLDEANAELREVDRLKTEFVASVSHELRTPLTSIRGYAELLLDDAPEDEANQQTRMLNIIDRNARRLLNLIEDLLLLSKVDSKTLAHKVEPIDLVELVDGAVVVLQPTTESAGVAIVTELDPHLPVEGDRSQLERVLFNLLSNAVKFSHPGRTVTVGGRVDGEKVVLTVADTGLGVSAEELPRLFTRFFRSANDEAHNIPGTGLGLAVVREIVENHDGEVTMASTLGEGSTVTVTLPLRR